MPVPPAFPGPDALGRSLVVLPGSPVPAPFADCPRIRIDADAPDADARRFLARRWNTRQRVVIELTGRALDVDMAESCNAPVWELDPAFDFAHERWRVLVWANAYDARDGTPRWPATAVARRVAAANGVPVRTSGRADLELADGTAVWVDDGPADAVALAGPARRLPRASLAIGRWHLPATGPTAIDPGLDVEQREVVAHGAGPIRVVAPAGSGKTRVLVARTSRLVSAHAVLPERITAIAYNTRAAAELRHRIQHPDVRVRTFHALAQSILAVGGVRSRIDLPRSRQLLADTLPPPARDVHRTRDAAVDAYLAAATQIRLGLRPPEQVADERRDVPDLARVFTRYRSGLAAAGMLDFDEQVVQAIELLLRSPTLRHRVRHHTAQLLVDEMQDCTPAFALLVKLLTGPAQQCVLVGDDDQTIYRHAGADPTWLQHPGSWLDTPRTVTLRVNHRCPGDVVDAAERLLARVADRTPRSTRAATGRRDGLHVHHIAPSQRATAMLTAVHRASSPDEVAVLARTNATLLVAQVALAAASIPRTTGVSPGLLQQPAFATVLAYLRIAIEPTRIRRADLAAVLRRPRRKLAAAVLPKVAATTSRRRLGLLTRTLDRDHRPAFRRLLDDLDDLAAASADATTPALLANIARVLVPPDDLIAVPVRTAVNDAADALAAVAVLGPRPDAFARWVRAMLAVDSARSGVTLTTIHRAKGREWDHVILDGVDDGVVPHRHADSDADERRILHVGLTRCRTRVDVLAAAHAPSPLVAELGVAPCSTHPSSHANRGVSRATRRSPRARSTRQPPASIPSRSSPTHRAVTRE